MEGITIGDVAKAFALIVGIAGPIIGVVAYFNKRVLQQLSTLTGWNKRQQQDIDGLLEERPLILRGINATLAGLVELGCDGEVKNAWAAAKDHTYARTGYGASRRETHDDKGATM